MSRPGLRERKKQKTRSAIQREAMRLFQEQGYDATTVEQIAEAAEVSQSTFFRYFPTKEDVILLDDYDPLLMQMIADRPADEAPVTAVRNAIVEAMRMVFTEEEEQLVRDRVGFMASVPAVRARMWEGSETTQVIFREALAKRAGRDPEDFDVAIVAGAILGALSIVVMEWPKTPDANLAELADRALDVVERGLKL
jgi:AcrR family transcriptional regulator